jgi:hypothetical protein
MQAATPERLRADGSPLPRTRCSWARIGTDRRRPPRARRGTRGSPRSGRPGPGRRPPRDRAGRRSRGCPAEEFRHLGHQILRLRASDGRSGHEDGVVSVPDPANDLGPRRSEDAPSSVPVDRRADLATCDERDRPRSGREEHYHPLASQRPPHVEHASHVMRAHGAPSAPLRRRAASGPCAAERRGSLGRPASASDGGSRAPSSDDGCSVGTCACPWPWSEGPRSGRGSRRRRPARVYGPAIHAGQAP